MDNPFDDQAKPLYQLALNQGFRYAMTERHTYSSGEIETEITLLRFQPQFASFRLSLVNDTGTALGEIEVQVARINDLIQSIVTGAREQSNALAEINSAVNQMDQMTQQNAAMVEQTTAVTHRLAGGAASLDGLVRQFTLSGRSAVSAPVRAGMAGAVAQQSAARPANPPRGVSASNSGSRPVQSPARAMINTVAKAFGGGKSTNATAASQDDWEEF